jgi:hypothetical protein
MSENLSRAAIEAPSENNKTLPAPVVEPAAVRVAQAEDRPPLDWGHAVDAAAARLEEVWSRPDPEGHMLALGLADELAATLSAYHMTAAEADHRQDRADRVARDAKRREFDIHHPALIDRCNEKLDAAALVRSPT